MVCFKSWDTLVFLCRVSLKLGTLWAGITILALGDVATDPLFALYHLEGAQASEIYILALDRGS